MSPTSDDISNADEAPMVKQPPVLVGGLLLVSGTVNVTCTTMLLCYPHICKHVVSTSLVGSNAYSGSSRICRVAVKTLAHVQGISEHTVRIQQQQSPSCLSPAPNGAALLCCAVLRRAVLPQVLLGVIIDSVFPQRESPAACARGALAKHIVEQQAEQVQASLLDPDAEITVPGPTAGEGHVSLMAWALDTYAYSGVLWSRVCTGAVCGTCVLSVWATCEHALP